MNKKIAIGASILIIVIMIVAAFMPMLNVIGAPPRPYNRYGTAYDSVASPLPDDTKITSYVDGVLYGTNLTWTSAGLGTGSYDMDTIGDDPTTDDIKEGGYAPEDVMYVIGDMTGTGTAKICEEVGSWETAGLISEAINEASSSDQPTLLKINNITTQPSEGNQYIYIYGPEDTDMSTYYLEKNDGKIHGPRVNFTGLIPVSGLYYVDLFETDFLNANGDELKLVWRNSGAAFDGKDIVVDRIEFNDTTHYGVPDNTRTNYLVEDDATAPGSGDEMYRTTIGVDTDDCSADFGLQTETGRNIPQKFKQDLVKYYTLISLPLNLTNYYAENLILDINADSAGDPCTDVLKWDDAAQSWSTHHIGMGNNFIIEPWAGYFVYCTDVATWIAEGPVAESKTMSLVKYYTLVGMTMDLKDPTSDEPATDAYYSAEDLILDINADSAGDPCTDVLMWDDAAQSWSTHHIGMGNNFRIERGIGYFVYLTDTGNWIP